MEGVKGGIVRDVDGVGGGWIGGETRIFEHTAVEEEFEERRVSSEPWVWLVVGFGSKAMVGDVRAEVVGEWVVGGGAVCEDIEIETWWEVTDMDPAIGAVWVQIGLLLESGGRENGEDE